MMATQFKVVLVSMIFLASINLINATDGEEHCTSYGTGLVQKSFDTAKNQQTTMTPVPMVYEWNATLSKIELVRLTHGTCDLQTGNICFNATCDNGFVKTSKTAGETGQLCQACEAGRSNVGNACETCPTGTYSEGGTVCQSCPDGKTGNAGASACQNCSAGKYSSGGTTCQSCPDGKSGPVSATDANSCQNCLAGKYSHGGTICQNCPDGKTGNAGANWCQNCSAGKYSSGGAVCQSCPAGTYSSSGTVCQSCPNGKTGNAGASACQNCAAGTYSSGGAACQSCPAGKYATGGATSCSICDAGTSAGSGSASCSTCTSGSYAAALSATCTNCPAGKTGNADASACRNCSAGQYSEGGTECMICPTGTSSATGSTNASSCQMPPKLWWWACEGGGRAQCFGDGNIRNECDYVCEQVGLLCDTNAANWQMTENQFRNLEIWRVRNSHFYTTDADNDIWSDVDARPDPLVPGTDCGTIGTNQWVQSVSVPSIGGKYSSPKHGQCGFNVATSPTPTDQYVCQRKQPNMISFCKCVAS